MAVQIGAKPLASFDRPLEMLVDCHRRVEHFLGVLIRVETLYRGKALDAQAILAFNAAQLYFQTSALKHTADEEESLFPRMKSQLPAGDDTLETLGQLEADHKLANELHLRVDRFIETWCATPAAPPPADRAEQFTSDLRRLKQHYEEHIRLEEQSVFPEAARYLSSELIAEIGCEMRERRQS
jgi:hemerythrin-like domain-containing protein